MTGTRRVDERIILAVSGGIAAYKVPELIRELQRRGYAHLDTILTKGAGQFVTPVTLEALTGRVPYQDTFETGRALSHVDLVQHAGILAVVPATANVIGKFASGVADDFLTTAYLAATCPVLVVPSMNTRMFEHPATRRNLETLRQDGVHVLEPTAGYLACGTYGRGRMPEIPIVADWIEYQLHRQETGPLSGRRVLIASGGTVEPIDPVRMICNRSTGRMGMELARACGMAGADVTVVAGPGTVRYPDFADVKPVETAAQMAQAVLAHASEADAVIMAAAVADYTPADPATSKMKKTDGPRTLTLNRTTDILRELGTRYGGTSKVLVGFAAETEAVEASALRKLEEKHADLVVGNRVGAADTGFAAETTEVVLVRRDLEPVSIGMVTKEALAWRIVGEIAPLLEQPNG